MSPLEQKMQEIQNKEFLYVPYIKPIPETVHDKLLIGGKAFIEEMWSDIWTQIISIKFKKIPTIIFPFHMIEPMQKDLEDEFGELEAHYEEEK